MALDILCVAHRLLQAVFFFLLRLPDDPMNSRSVMNNDWFILVVTARVFGTLIV